MIMRILLYVVAMMGAICLQSVAHAGSCTIFGGGTANANVVIPSDLILNNNVSGFMQDVTPNPNTDKSDAICTCNPDQVSGTGRITSLWDWSEFNNALQTERVGEKTFAIINNYLEVAAQPLGTSNPNSPWTPYVNNEHVITGSYLCNSKTQASGGIGIITLRIRTPFVGQVDIPPTLLYTKGSNTAKTDAYKVPEINFYLSGSVLVPQSCEFTPDTTVSITFPDAASANFSRAGAGKIPAGMNPVTKELTLKCKGMGNTIDFKLRLEAAHVSTRTTTAIVPDAGDSGVGFIVADKKGKPLIPNDSSSSIPFTLNSQTGMAVVPITTWPVSTDGSSPVAGVYLAEGYLRVDFD